MSADAKLLADLIPTNWLDPLLTGPDAVICGGTFDCADIERLLRAIKERVTEAERSRYVSQPVSGIKLVKAFKDQRDELATVLRELLRLYDWRNEIGRIERDFNHDKKQVTTWLNQYGREKKAAWIAARAILDKCPSYEQQLANICAGLGITREQLKAAVSTCESEPAK